MLVYSFFFITVLSIVAFFNLKIKEKHNFSFLHFCRRSKFGLLHHLFSDCFQHTKMETPAQTTQHVWISIWNHPPLSLNATTDKSKHLQNVEKNQNFWSEYKWPKDSGLKAFRTFFVHVGFSQSLTNLFYFHVLVNKYRAFILGGPVYNIWFDSLVLIIFRAQCTADK